ncbi:hypothetical protein [Shewanella sp.]|uniref:hypothetical protein n=1 Tax=Shewanella sp. TaxID=50422 RepID=UPI003F671F39
MPKARDEYHEAHFALITNLSGLTMYQLKSVAMLEYRKSVALSHSLAPKVPVV